jgi:hypothetical protein
VAEAQVPVVGNRPRQRLPRQPIIIIIHR